MKHKLILVPFLALLSLTAMGRPQKRSVIIDTICEATVMHMLHVVDSFYYQFQACPDSLFLWAYLGLEDTHSEEQKTKEGREAIQLKYIDRVYDPDNKIGDVTIDIYVLGVRWWKDQHLVTQYLFEASQPHNILTANLVAKYSGSILESGEFRIIMEPVSNSQTRIHYEFSMTFGRILSAFISDKTWQNAIEWRFETILENLVECAETGTVQPKFRGPKIH